MTTNEQDRVIERIGGRFDGAIVSKPDEHGCVEVRAVRHDVEMGALYVVSPEGIAGYAQ